MKIGYHILFMTLNVIFLFQVLKVTPLGKAVSAFPLLPRYGKMLALSHQFNLLPYAIALVAALTVQEVCKIIHMFIVTLN